MWGAGSGDARLMGAKVRANHSAFDGRSPPVSRAGAFGSGPGRTPRPSAGFCRLRRPPLPLGPPGGSAEQLQCGASDSDRLPHFIIHKSRPASITRGLSAEIKKRRRASKPPDRNSESPSSGRGAGRSPSIAAPPSRPYAGPLYKLGPPRGQGAGARVLNAQRRPGFSPTVNPGDAIPLSARAQIAFPPRKNRNRFECARQVRLSDEDGEATFSRNTSARAPAAPLPLTCRRRRRKSRSARGPRREALAADRRGPDRKRNGKRRREGRKGRHRQGERAGTRVGESSAGRRRAEAVHSGGAMSSQKHY
ncbi:hypothetical protein SKAU_G00143170 [Synaphobranchus kaupii]|uniref:Uncharacterized protein n=1 Tax=Synaphobranchus kaupii TaxID=118154 RepID=A0A9Q1FSL1_SYNKA|nr:hypothetical protein SKAU_G00143170 [Synaphobranchus kaupii]